MHPPSPGLARVKPVSLRAAAVVTDPGSPPLHDAVVDVADGRVTALRPARLLTRRDTVTELDEALLAAGVIDAHVHLGFDSSETPEAVMIGPSPRELARLVTRRARELLRAGVTTVRDLGCTGTVVTDLSESTRNDPTLPTILAANQPLTVPGGHCDYMATPCTGLPELLAAVDQRHAQGARVIKIMLTGGFIHAEGDTPYRPVYDRDTLRRVVDHAHRHGLAVAAHAHGTKGIAVAVDAGVDSVEHCSMAIPGGVDFDPGLARRMGSQDIYAVPTVSSLWDGPLPWAGRAHALGIITQLHEHGVPLALGTDTGIPGVFPGDHVAGLGILAEAGLSGAQVWAAAATNAAALCGLSQHVGQVREGFVADLLVLDADPREELSTLGRPLRVVRAGYPVDQTVTA